MKSRLRFSVYHKGVQAYLESDTKLLERILASSGLSQPEKSLLRSRTLLRERKWKLAEQAIATEMADIFLEAERQFILGNIAGFRAEWEDALMSNLRALDYYQRDGDRRGQFLTNYNLSVDAAQLGLSKLASRYFEQAKVISENADEKNMILRAEAWRAVENFQNDRAVALIDEALSLRSDLAPSELAMLLAVASDIKYRAGQIVEARELLGSLRHSKIIRDRGRVLFELALIERMLKGTAPFEALQDPPVEVEKSDAYCLRWNIIRELQRGEIEKAEALWVDLCASLPQVYLPHFASRLPTEQNSIFMNFVNAVRSSSQRDSLPREIGAKPKSEVLVQTLREAGSPLRKEFLIERIWGSYHPDYEARFYKLIERLRKNSGIKIENKNQTYFIAS